MRKGREAGSFQRSQAIDITLRRPEDADRLKQLIRQATNAKQRDRLRTVERAIAGQKTLAIMEMLGRSRGFVQRWCYVYRDHGLEAVVAKSPPGRPTRLPTEHHEAFKRRVLAGPTETDGVCTLRGYDCIAILEAEFGVQYSLSGVYELLHRLNLAVLVPRPQHRHNDPEAMRKWADRAPFLSATCSKKTPKNAQPSGSKTRPASDNKAR